MNFKLKETGISVLIFIIIAAILFVTQWFLAKENLFIGSYRIHLLIFVLSLIVVLSVVLFYIFGPKDKLGFVFLGFVVFKMFGIGYLAVFEPEFKQNIIPYFVLFWIYLAAEALITAKLIRKQDINHKKQL